MKLFAILSAFTLGCAIQATPLFPETGGDKGILTKFAFGTSREEALNSVLENKGLYSLVNTTALHTAVTSPAHASSIEMRQFVNPTPVFCSGSGCTGSCVASTFVSVTRDTRYNPTPGSFLSTFISDPTEVSLLVQLGVGGPGYTGLVVIPEVNVCFNFSPVRLSWTFLTGTTPG